MSGTKIINEDENNKLATTDQSLDFRRKLENFQKILHYKPRKILQRQGVSYVPIDAIEKHLDKMFFGIWKWEMLFEPKRELNEIIVCGRLHYFHPVALVWLFRDGVGVAQVRIQSGKDWTDFQNKIQNGLEMDVPHAEADALKSAAGKIGDSFGRNLGRKETEKYETFYPPEEIKLSKEHDDIYMGLLIRINSYDRPTELRKAKDGILAEAKTLPKEWITKIETELQNAFNKLSKRK